MTVQSYNLLQLIGRAGRCGHESRGHIFTNSREIRTCSDEALVEFCVSKENCRRRVLLNALGSSESLPSGTSCCDVCSPTAELVSIFHPIAVGRKPRQHAVRSVSKPLAKHLKDRLLAERDVIVASDIGYRMLGKNMVLPDTCIDMLCKKAKFITQSSDISTIPGLRGQFANRIFDVILEVVSKS